MGKCTLTANADNVQALLVNLKSFSVPPSNAIYNINLLYKIPWQYICIYIYIIYNYIITHIIP